MLTTLHTVFRYLNLFSIFSLAFLLNTSIVNGQPQQEKGWKKELSKTKGQDRLDLLLKLSNDLLEEDISLADSLAKEGISLAQQLGDSLSMYRIGATLGRIFYIQTEIGKGLEWVQKSLKYFDQHKNLAFDKAKLQLTLAGLYIK